MRSVPPLRQALILDLCAKCVCEQGEQVADTALTGPALPYLSSAASAPAAPYGQAQLVPSSGAIPSQAQRTRNAVPCVASQQC